MMTKKQVMGEFREIVLPAIRKLEKNLGHVDDAMRREEWNNYVDAEQKAGRLTRHQADTWSNPY